jgi:hypothetical protein
LRRIARAGEFVAKEENDGSFRVIDRRLFNEAGELRKDVAEQMDSGPAEGKAAAKPAPGPGAPAGGAAASHEPPAAAPSPMFRALVDFLTQNAAMLLGAYPNPATGQSMLDLEGAREMIDMMDALRDKTRGSLASEDDDLLNDRLGRLKFSYLEMTKAAANAMREKSARKS